MINDESVREAALQFQIEIQNMLVNSGGRIGPVIEQLAGRFVLLEALVVELEQRVRDLEFSDDMRG